MQLTRIARGEIRKPVPTEGMTPVTVSTRGDRRRSERFHIECPVTVVVLGRGKGRELGPGRLYDIGIGGARFRLGEQLGIGTRLRMHVAFPSPNRGVSRVRFEGTVTRAGPEPQYETAMQFHRGGRFLREGLEPLLVKRAKAQTEAS